MQVDLNRPAPTVSALLTVREADSLIFLLTQALRSSSELHDQVRSFGNALRERLIDEMSNL